MEIELIRVEEIDKEKPKEKITSLNKESNM